MPGTTSRAKPTAIPSVARTTAKKSGVNASKPETKVWTKLGPLLPSAICRRA